MKPVKQSLIYLLWAMSCLTLSAQARPIEIQPLSKNSDRSGLTPQRAKAEADRLARNLRSQYASQDLLPPSESSALADSTFTDIVSDVRTNEPNQASFQIADAAEPESDDPSIPTPPEHWSSGRPDGHAPIGVMGDHTHSIGEVMLSYRYVRMDMSGNLDGTTNLTPAQVLQQFPVTPVRMSMDMHMFGAMYAPTNSITLMGMLPYVTKEMDHVTRMGTRFTTRSSGFGDASLGALFKVLDKKKHRVHLNFSTSIPTGSTNKRDDTPAGPDQILPYPMQLGSGTFDLRPGFTYLGQTSSWSWGGQVLGIIRLGENENSYQLGNAINGTVWGAKKWTDAISTSLRLNLSNIGDISGADPRLNPTVVPTADPDLRGGTRLDLSVGLNLFAPKGFLKGGRFAFEAGLPIFQSLDGPQLESDWRFTAGIQYAF